jgi:hypothetical protein
MSLIIIESSFDPPLTEEQFLERVAANVSPCLDERGARWTSFSAVGFEARSGVERRAGARRRRRRVTTSDGYCSVVFTSSPATGYFQVLLHKWNVCLSPSHENIALS